VSEPALDYARLLARVREVVDDVRGEREVATSECLRAAEVYERLLARRPEPHEEVCTSR
jgi:hypothetical protein